MATPQPPLTPEQRLAAQQRERTLKLLRNAAIAGVIICPIVAILPPRKLDLYTFGLGICFYLSADHLTESYTGRSIFENMAYKVGAPGSALPTERAREFQRLQEERKREREGVDKVVPVQRRGILQRIWMGDEKDGWKERRLQEEKEKLERGETYTGMIMDQIWEVWNWDKKKGGEEEEKKDKPKKE
ncbi:hypothetical protein BCR34DRAFT_358841 [Clohesyomyces aquaticus]|uniref:Uncharacterized protein n=1 Tax=Clohesyomyces aquaticus TaxID=1231657 RepID=A0A1Y1ZIF8_9PLEO|nr:hypothetical protein BCR34DRAFT_358841 [Clohesyomyces aquaticus]